MPVGSIGVTLEHSEIAYSRNFDSIGDASPVDLDMNNLWIVIRNNYFHHNEGSCLETNIGGGGNRNIFISDNVCSNNGLEDNSDISTSYLKAAFLADACYYSGRSPSHLGQYDLCGISGPKIEFLLQ